MAVVRSDTLATGMPAAWWYAAAISTLALALADGLFMAWPWSNLWSGLLASLIHLPFVVIGVSSLVAPYSLLVIGVYQWLGWRRWRIAWLLAPTALAIILALLIVAPGRPTAMRQLQEFTGAGCPKAPSELRHDFRGGGLVDLDLQFVFRCSSKETQTLIRELKLDHDPTPIKNPERLPADWPDYRTWPGVKRYMKDDIINNVFIELTTDGAHAQVYLKFFSI